MSDSKKAAKVLLEDINCHIDSKRASMQFLKAMGYVKTENKVVVRLDGAPGEAGKRLLVFELADENGSPREIPFSFLYDPQLEDGIILPFPYGRYKDLTKKPTAAAVS